MNDESLMGRSDIPDIPDIPMSEPEFQALREAILAASTRMSCHQALDLADLLHTVIRMRRPARKLRNLGDLFRGHPGCGGQPAPTVVEQAA